VGLAIAVLTLAIGPWVAFPSGAFSSAPMLFASSVGGPGPVSSEPFSHAAPIGSAGRSATGCTCREVVVNATNVVRDAEVESGDAEVINTAITYITPTYGDTEVEVDQEADARSGDAIAGQLLAVDAGDGCARVHVNASNLVEDAEVTSGDAIARNTSLVLLDPSIDRGDLEIDVDQEATAKSGRAVAGQVIGVKGGGGPCGSVIVDAINRVRDVEVQTGDSVAENLSEILSCADHGCLKEIRAVLADVPLVTVCEDVGCHPVRTEAFVKMIKEAIDNPDTEAIDETTVGGSPQPNEVDTRLEKLRRRHRRNHRPPEEVATDTGVEETPVPSSTPAPEPYEAA
jgi:hypothetical protein